MSKHTGADRSVKKESYNSSSAPAVWIVVTASTFLVVVAVIGTV